MNNTQEIRTKLNSMYPGYRFEVKSNLVEVIASSTYFLLASSKFVVGIVDTVTPALPTVNIELPDLIIIFLVLDLSTP